MTAAVTAAAARAAASVSFVPARNRAQCIVDAALPTEGTTEQDLLAGLLTFSRSMASASALLHHFPSIGHVISAEASQLRAFGLSGRDIAVLRLVHQIACRMAIAEVRSRPVLSNWQALIAYLQTAMAYQQIEQFRILFLDRKNSLIADEVQQRGTVNHTPVYPREVMKRALDPQRLGSHRCAFCSAPQNARYVPGAVMFPGTAFSLFSPALRRAQVT
jgi:hypothetical protein